MERNKLGLLRAKEIVTIVAWTAWILVVMGKGDDLPFLPPMAWICTAVWVALDEHWQRGRISASTILTLLTGPIGFGLYYYLRPPAQSVCSQCGSAMPSQWRPCPTCGHAILLARAWRAITGVYSRLMDSLVHSPIDKARDTAKYLAIAFAAAIIVGSILSPLIPWSFYIVPFFAATYWIMVAWWVYLDSVWRKMDGMPWAVLTLVTNVIGLVTYLVIRYPDPRMCVHCGQSVATDLKYCPFCGLEIEPMCPHCQAPLKSDWRFCPVCSARLTSDAASETESRPIGITIGGSVLDADQGTAIVGAVVAIDSRESSISTLTDAMGKFELAGLDQRPYVLAASVDGYDLQAKAYSPDTDSGKRMFFTLKQCVKQ
ncbi:MAG: zinc ribbon domain-containing protein [Armatimonadota bacterium]|nr:zinc ribbon domain-containing protein [bacterium]